MSNLLEQAKNNVTDNQNREFLDAKDKISQKIITQSSQGLSQAWLTFRFDHKTTVQEVVKDFTKLGFNIEAKYYPLMLTPLVFPRQEITVRW